MQRASLVVLACGALALHGWAGLEWSTVAWVLCGLAGVGVAAALRRCVTDGLKKYQRAGAWAMVELAKLEAAPPPTPSETPRVGERCVDGVDRVQPSPGTSQAGDAPRRESVEYDGSAGGFEECLFRVPGEARWLADTLVAQFDQRRLAALGAIEIVGGDFVVEIVHRGKSGARRRYRAVTGPMPAR